MKPFDLKKALAGEEVVTREGDKVKILQTINNNNYPIVGIITYSDGTQTIESWTKNGQFAVSNKKSKYDLFMAPKRIITINIIAERQMDSPAFTKNETEILIYRNVSEEDLPTLKRRLSSIGFTITEEITTITEE